MRSPRAGVEVFAMGEGMTQPQPLGLHRPIDATVDVGASSLAGRLLSVIDFSLPREINVKLVKYHLLLIFFSFSSSASRVDPNVYIS